MTYRTPRVNGDGIFAGDLSPLGVTHRRLGRLVGRRRLPQVRAHRRPTSRTSCWPACATSRRRWARLATRRTSTRGPVRAPSGCCACGTTAPGRSTTRSASAAATRTPPATTTSGACRSATTPGAPATRVYRYIRHRPVFRAGPAGSPRSAPTSPAATRRRLPRPTRSTSLRYPAFAPAACAVRCTSSRSPTLAEEAPRRPSPTTTTLRSSGVTTWSSGATELYLALADGGTTVPGLTHDRSPVVPALRRSLGQRPTSTGPTTPPTR